MQIAHESDGLVVLSSRTMRLARGSEKMTPTFGSQKASSALVRPLITTSGIVPPLMTPGMSGAGRLIARKRDGRVRLLTRRGYDWTERYPRIREALATLRTASATIDGEAVICDGSGVAVTTSALRKPTERDRRSDDFGHRPELHAGRSFMSLCLEARPRCLVSRPTRGPKIRRFRFCGSPGPCGHIRLGGPR